jgi:hypothetical protein
MKAKVFKSLIAIFFIFLSFMTQAGTGPFKVTVDYYPYIGSLGDSAEAVEAELQDKATAACGSFSNVASLVKVDLHMKQISVINMGINVNGIPGSKGSDAVFIFSYPRVTGSADVFCKH